jgi:D-glycero-D-manno-heptose 1,7-bisphosphate phosphatase
MKADSIDLSRSFLIGDKASDIDLARAVGIRGIQVSSGKYERHPNAFQVVEELEELSGFNWA